MIARKLTIVPRTNSTRFNLLARSPSIELLETRRVLTTPAVGSFDRVNTGAADDITTNVSAGSLAIDGVAFDENPDSPTPPWVEMGAEDLVRNAIPGRTASAGGATASALAKAAGYILPPMYASAPVPFVSSEGVQVGSAHQNSGFGQGSTNSTIAIDSVFAYDDPSPTVDKLFYGAIYIPALAAGLATGEDASWGGGNLASVTVFKNEEPIVTVTVTLSTGGSTDTNPGTTVCVVSIAFEGQDPYGYQTSGGTNLYVNFTTSIEHGDEIEFSTSISNSSGSTNAFAENVSDNLSSLSQYTIAISATAYGFAYAAESPPVLPPPWNENDGDPEVFHYSSAPGDLNGDGVVDDDDALTWANVLDAASENEVTPLIVTTEEDLDDGDYSFHDLSLREAIYLAGTDAYPGTDTVVFAKWLEEIDLNGTELLIASGNNVNIVAPGADQLTIDAQSTSRIFNVNSGVTATLRGLHLTGGSAGNGGAINTSGTLTVDQCQIDDNAATNGAGVYASFSSGALVVSNSTIANNVATGGRGGGLSVNPTSTATVTILNSTIANNEADDRGGGIYKNTGSGIMYVKNSTIVGNTLENSSGAGIRSMTANTVRLDNTIVANNTSPTYSTPTDLSGTYVTGSSYNLVTSTTSGISNGSYNNQVGAINVMIAGLADNGGSVLTMALLTGSPAIDKGDSSFNPNSFSPSMLYDERGGDYARIVDGDVDSVARIDIGAFEYAPPPSVASAVAALDASFADYERGQKDRLVLASLVHGDELTKSRKPWRPRVVSPR